MANTTKAKKVNFKARVSLLIGLILTNAAILSAERFIFHTTPRTIIISLIVGIVGIIYFTWELTDELD
jgi:hypothetical protein